MRMLKLAAKSGECKIVLGESISRLMDYAGAKNTVIISDANVRRLHGSLFPKAPVIEIGQGEGEKTLATVESAYEQLLALGADRSTFVIGIGGGIVCDVAGFVASTYLRGLPFGFAPTTLLAQVDAGIGGKNGVNFLGYKNLVGTFAQPKFVLCDFDVLAALPREEISHGLAEAIKSAAIGDAALFAYLEGNCEAALKLHRTAIEKVVHDSLAVKAGIVSTDEREAGERRKLNFGHTIGHALEKVCGMPHGDAISVGMVLAARLSVTKGMLQEKDAIRLEMLLAKAGLPTGAKFDRSAVVDAISKDKKRQGDAVNFVLLEGIGKAKVAEVKMGEIEGVLDDLH
jgi:3-dehydroquinate synthase